MSELYYRAAREGATRKALDEARKRLKAVEENAKEFSRTMDDMQRKLDELSKYRESKQFKADAIAHVAAHPREAAEALCFEESVGKAVI